MSGVGRTLISHVNILVCINDHDDEHMMIHDEFFLYLCMHVILLLQLQNCVYFIQMQINDDGGLLVVFDSVISSSPMIGLYCFLYLPALNIQLALFFN